MNDYISNGGDGYSMFSKYDVVLEGIYTDTDSIAYFIKNDLNGTIPAEYKDFQGRINLVNDSSFLLFLLLFLVMKSLNLIIILTFWDIIIEKVVRDCQQEVL